MLFQPGLGCFAPGGQAGTSSKIENYLGFPTGIGGQQLASRAQLPDEYDRGEFQKDWASLLREGDPFFNPNLSQHSDLWSPQPEPRLATVLKSGNEFTTAVQA